MNLWKIYAQNHPQEILIIETDKQNSKTTVFPFFHRIPKNGEHLLRVTINLQSVIYNGCQWKSWIILPIHSRHANISITLRFNDLVDYTLTHQKLPSVLRRKFSSNFSSGPFLFLVFLWCCFFRFLWIKFHVQTVIDFHINMLCILLLGEHTYSIHANKQHIEYF